MRNHAVCDAESAVIRGLALPADPMCWRRIRRFYAPPSVTLIITKWKVKHVHLVYVAPSFSSSSASNLEKCKLFLLKRDIERGKWGQLCHHQQGKNQNNTEGYNGNSRNIKTNVSFIFLRITILSALSLKVRVFLKLSMQQSGIFIIY